MPKKNKLVGLSVIRNVMSDLDDLIRNSDINLLKNTVINVSELVKTSYGEDLENFRMITSKIGFIIDEVYYKGDTSKIQGYELMIFSDDKIQNLEKINLTDVLGLFDVDLSDYKHLSRCTLHFNRLYNKDQFNMIPGIPYTYIV